MVGADHVEGGGGHVLPRIDKVQGYGPGRAARLRLPHSLRALVRARAASLRLHQLPLRHQDLQAGGVLRPQVLRALDELRVQAHVQGPLLPRLPAQGASLRQRPDGRAGVPGLGLHRPQPPRSGEVPADDRLGGQRQERAPQVPADDRLGGQRQERAPQVRGRRDRAGPRLAPRPRPALQREAGRGPAQQAAEHSLGRAGSCTRAA